MRKRKIWVLDSGTKGTGAEMVPLEKVLKEPEPVLSPRSRPSAAAGAAKEPEPTPARRFKLVDS